MALRPPLAFCSRPGHRRIATPRPTDCSRFRNVCVLVHPGKLSHLSHFFRRVANLAGYGSLGRWPQVLKTPSLHFEAWETTNRQGRDLHFKVEANQ